jgi:ubiquinone/menaquinone biosynthesis C-methylase UbiE
MNDRPELEHHYGANGFIPRLEDALIHAGLNGQRLSAADLAPLDQFHARGLDATVELAEAAGLLPSDTIVDLGSGLGGPSRYIAATLGCRVSGVDLSPAFVESATYLARRSELSDKVEYLCADVLELPFADATFSVAWTQHVAMNIANRDGFYREVHRVLRPGGRFAIYDIVTRGNQSILYPVPWSRTPATSFLLSSSDMLARLLRQGFQTRTWTDCTEAAIIWFDEQRSKQSKRVRPGLGLQIAMGPEFPQMAANLERNLRDGHVGLIQAVMIRT